MRELYSFPYRRKRLLMRPIASWSFGMPSGSIAFDQSGNGFNASCIGVDLNQPGIDGRDSASFDGVNDSCNWYSAAAAARFNGQEGSADVWFKMGGSGVWTDGAIRYLFYCLADANNFLYLRKQAANGTLAFVHKANSITKAFDLASLSTLDFAHMVMTWSVTADQVKAYFNGVLVNTASAGMGVWAGTPASSGCFMGANSSVPAGPHSGFIAYGGLWDRALSAAEVAELYRVTP